jgi:hypothetical protein
VHGAFTAAPCSLHEQRVKITGGGRTRAAPERHAAARMKFQEDVDCYRTCGALPVWTLAHWPRLTFVRLDPSINCCFAVRVNCKRSNVKTTYACTSYE